MVTWEQRALAGDPKFEDSQDLPDVNYAGFANMPGLKGVRIDHPDQIPEALDYRRRQTSGTGRDL